MTTGFRTASNKVLLVEGQSDCNFVSQFRDKLNLGLEFDIDDKGGLPRLLEAVYSEVVTSGRDVVGLMVDADHDDNPSWPKLKARLAESGIEVPEQPQSNGIVVAATDTRPRIGVWLMPDNRSTGELENFVIDMIDEDDLIWPKAVEYIDKIPRDERKFNERKTDRAKLYAWLAARKNPPHIGSAVRAGDLDADTDHCKSFAGWLERLFATGD